MQITFFNEKKLKKTFTQQKKSKTADQTERKSERERSLGKYSQCSALYLTLENLQNDLQIHSVPTTL